MSLDIGIIGLTKSGKTTVFNGLTKGQAGTASTAPHLGTARVPEPRLNTLADILHPKRVVPAEVKYIDIGAARSPAKDKAADSQLLTQVGNVDALLNVVRAFGDETIPHIAGSIDVDRDIASMNLELAFSDMAIIEKRLERIQESLKGAKQFERQGLIREQEMLIRIRSQLEKDKPIREMDLSNDEARTMANYQFLTAKPLLIVVNIGEEQLGQASSLEAELNKRHSHSKCRAITLCGKLEMELAQLDEAAAKQFRAEYGLAEPGLDRTVKLSYELLGLISFFTIASGEVRAWSIPKGTSAVEAAGKIHSDMEKGFIRAEVVSYEELVKSGGLSEARHKGVLRLEGKGYTVQDGDVITFLFNV